MRSESLQVENGKKEGTRRGGGAFIPLTQNIAVTALRPGIFGVNSETPGSPETPG
jgi:hypothetical protein